MPVLLDLFYLLLSVILFPWLAYKALTTGKYRRGMLRKLLGQAVLRENGSPCAWFHGVSVGEIHLLGQIVARFRQRHPDWDCVITTTTETGYAEACKRFPELQASYWPIDFSWAVRRALGRINPTLVILAESELWPNFLLAAKERGIPVALINARVSPRSLKRYQKLRKIVGPLLRLVDLLAVQTEEYATGLRSLGVVPERVFVTGSVKYDGVSADRHNSRTEQLRRLLAVRDGDLIWIAGSTQAPEEQIAVDIYRRARARYPNLRLMLVPRQKERFDEVANLLERDGQSFVRRSNLTEGELEDRSAVVLIDTIGELGALWGLADVAFVGGSLDGRRGGQNMIEPAAYGAAVLFGPHVWNFKETAARLVQADAAIQIVDAAGLQMSVFRLFDSKIERERLGDAAKQFVRSQQGATERTLDLLDRLIVEEKIHDRAA